MDDTQDYDGAGYPVFPKDAGTPDAVIKNPDGSITCIDLKMADVLSGDEGLARYALSIAALMGAQ